MAHTTGSRGFAAMDASKQREIASMGGKASAVQRSKASSAHKKGSDDLSAADRQKASHNSRLTT